MTTKKARLHSIQLEQRPALKVAYPLWQDMAGYLSVDSGASNAWQGPWPTSMTEAMDAAPQTQPEALGSMGGKGLLVVGLGDERHGDVGIGAHLMRCLSQLTWPEGVEFCHVDDLSWEKVDGYSKVILLDALQGPEGPGSLYQADAEALVACSANKHVENLERFLSVGQRRLLVFGVQPSPARGSKLSGELVESLSGMLLYLRMYILRAAAEWTQVN